MYVLRSIAADPEACEEDCFMWGALRRSVQLGKEDYYCAGQHKSCEWKRLVQNLGSLQLIIISNL